MSDMRIFSGRSNPAMAQSICQYLGLPLGRAQLDNFPDGEIQLKLFEDVRGRDTYVIQSTCSPVNDNLLELLIFIDCLKRASAERITAVIPYFGYARQDRKDEGRVPITAKLVANILTEAGADRVLTVELHAAQIQGFFDIPVDNMSAQPVFQAYFETLDLQPLTLVSPDVGNAKHARVYADRMGANLAIIDKRRISGSEAAPLGADRQRSRPERADDRRHHATAGTVVQAAKLVRQHGAADRSRRHARRAVRAGDRAPGRRTDRSHCRDRHHSHSGAGAARLPNLSVLTVSELIGEAVRRIHRHESVSSLFMK